MGHSRLKVPSLPSHYLAPGFSPWDSILWLAPSGMKFALSLLQYLKNTKVPLLKFGTV